MKIDKIIRLSCGTLVINTSEHKDGRLRTWINYTIEQIKEKDKNL